MDSAIEIAVRSKKPKAVALVKWLTKKGKEKVQEEHQQPITVRDNQIQALEATNEAHLQKILRLNEEIDDLIKNRHVARRGYFDNVLCFIKKNSKEAHPYYVIRCQYRQPEKYKRRLKLRYPNMEEVGRCDDPNAIHRWNLFKLKWWRNKVLQKPFQPDGREARNFWDCPWCHYLRPKILFCSLYKQATKYHDKIVY